MNKKDAAIVKSHIDLDERIRKRAHQIWLARKGDHAHDTSLEDWLQAEREVLGDAKDSALNRGSVVGPAGTSGDVEELGES